MQQSESWIEKWNAGTGAFTIDGKKYTVNDDMPEHHKKEFDRYCKRLEKNDEATVDITRTIKIGDVTYKNLSEVPKELIPVAESYLRTLSQYEDEDIEAKKRQTEKTKNYQIVFLVGMIVGAIITHTIHTSLT